MANSWKDIPTCFEHFNGEYDYMLFIDETGVPTLLYDSFNTIHIKTNTINPD